VSPEQALSELLALVSGPTTPFPWDRAALLLAVDEYPRLDLPRYLSLLDGYAAEVSAYPGAREEDPRARIGALRRVLFEEAGFQGNRGQYYDVRNSYLNEVLDRKLGLPLTLAVVMLAVGQRLNWPLAPVNFPGHFLVAYLPETPQFEPLALDPFHGGLILSEEELGERWRLATGVEMPPLPVLLRPAEPRPVVLRMLNNLRLAHREAKQYRSAALVNEKLAHLDPGEPRHDRDQAYLWLAAREPRRAERLLARYLERRPDAPDQEQVRDHLAQLRERLPPEE
jgi:regulator of sirC expression with transglutaminase-like and TPR domain